MIDSNSQKIIFERFYESQVDSVFRFCVLRVGSREEALDISAESWSRLWLEINKGKVIPQKKSYIFAIARNLIIDWYRKKKPSSLDFMLEGGDLDIPFDVEDTGIMSAEDASLAKSSLEVLKRVPASYREVLYLKFLEGLQPQEIGEIMGMSANAVSIRINRGLEEARKILNIKI